MKYCKKHFTKLKRLVMRLVFLVIVFFLNLNLSAYAINGSIEAEDKMPSFLMLKSYEYKEKNFSFFRFPFVLLIRFYQIFISPTKGQQCPMYPTCSQFGLEAFNRFGPILGWVLTADRLHRCGHDLKYYKRRKIKGILKFLDPVNQNVLGHWKKDTDK
jgi:putative membrane protein insertion efficiency factor